MTAPRVALYDDPLFRKHDAGPGHPERPERLDAIRRGIWQAGLEPRLLLKAPRPATTAELLRVHSAGHVAQVASTSGRTYRFDADTQAGPESYAAALLAAGAAAGAVDARPGRGPWTAPSARCVRPATTRSPTGPWASASSTTWRWPPPTPSPRASRA